MDFLPGISAATTGMIIGYPFDAIKIKMQTNMYPNSLSCIKNVAQTEGIHSLYRGVMAPLISQNLKRSIQYNVYEKILEKNKNPFISGFYVGCIGPIISCPTSVLKIGIQTRKNNTLPQYIKHIYKTKGLLGFYRGFPIYCIKEISHGTLYLGIYGSIREKYGISPISTFSAGCISSALTWTCLFPIDILKTSIQSYNNNHVLHLKTIVKKHHYHKLWKGLFPTLLKIVPVNGCIMLSYELTRHFVKKNK